MSYQVRRIVHENKCSKEQSACHPFTEKPLQWSTHLGALQYSAMNGGYVVWIDDTVKVE